MHLMSQMSFGCPMQRPHFGNHVFLKNPYLNQDIRYGITGKLKMLERGFRIHRGFRHAATASQDDSTKAPRMKPDQKNNTSRRGEEGSQNLQEPVEMAQVPSTGQGKKTWAELNSTYKASLEGLSAAESRVQDALAALTSHPDVQAERALHVLASLYGFSPEAYPSLHAVFQENLQSFKTEEAIEERSDMLCNVSRVWYEWSGKMVEWCWVSHSSRSDDYGRVDNIFLESNLDGIMSVVGDIYEKPEGELMKALGKIPGDLWPLCFHNEQDPVFPGSRHVCDVRVGSDCW